MIIVLNSKKTVLITSLGLCFLGTLLAALRIYYKTKSKKKQISSGKNYNKSKFNQKSTNGSVLGGSSGKLSRPYSLNFDHTTHDGTRPSSGAKISKTERALLLASANLDDVKNIPAEELLELGINYLNQAIKSWETALDSIESAAYMQSQTLALPNDEHADLVFKLRSLVDRASDINLTCNTKLIKSSQTLQIIQSRLAYKQQLYSEMLLKTSCSNNDDLNKANDDENNNVAQLSEEMNTNYATTPMGSLSKKYGYLSDDDNESFVSADSDVDWLDDDMLQRIENVNDKNALYEMAISSVKLGRVTYRVSRCELLNCKSEADFAAKLHVVRLGFDRLLQDSDKKEWLICEGRHLLSVLLAKAEKDPTGVHKAYDEIVKFVMSENSLKLMKDEMATREVTCLNFYDIALDFILLDSFDDLESPPSAITAVIQNRWLSQSFKETALSTAVWSILKAKRKMLKYPNGFITRFYSISEYLVPVLAWGFLGTDEELNSSCLYMKNHIVDYLKCLFDTNRTRYTNLEELTVDIEAHTHKYLEEMFSNI